MLGSGIRKLLARWTTDMDAKADRSFGGLTRASGGEDSARDEFITAYIIAPEPAAVSRAARLSRLPATVAGSQV